MSFFTNSYYMRLFFILFLVASKSVCASEVNEIAELLEQAKTKSDWQKVKLVNKWVNEKAVQSTDSKIWDATDYWASPFELLAAKAADCEDYATTKYFLLVESGVPYKSLYLSHVDINSEPEPHMVLLYEDPIDHGFYVLDNLQPQIKPAFTRPELHFKYSFNESSIYLGSPGEFIEQIGLSALQIKRWKAVVAKWQEERATLLLVAKKK